MSNTIMTTVKRTVTGFGVGLRAMLVLAVSGHAAAWERAATEWADAWGHEPSEG